VPTSRRQLIVMAWSRAVSSPWRLPGRGSSRRSTSTLRLSDPLAGHSRAWPRRARSSSVPQVESPDRMGAYLLITAALAAAGPTVVLHIGLDFQTLFASWAMAGRFLLTLLVLGSAFCSGGMVCRSCSATITRTCRGSTWLISSALRGRGGSRAGDESRGHATDDGSAGVATDAGCTSPRHACRSGTGALHGCGRPGLCAVALASWPSPGRSSRRLCTGIGTPRRSSRSTASRRASSTSTSTTLPTRRWRSLTVTGTRIAGSPRRRWWIRSL